MQEIPAALTSRERLHSRGICVIVPTYNNERTIADVVRRCRVQCADVIVVNDGCTDSTASILSGIDGIRVVTLERNSGKGTALKRGFLKALELGFSYAITLDADGQHFPEDIPLLLQANISNPEALIIGERVFLTSRAKSCEEPERSGGSRFANAFSNFWFAVQTWQRLKDTQSGYRLYPLHRLYGLSLLTSRYEAELELLVFSAWHGVKLVPQPVNVYYPPKGERVSHFRPAYDFTRISILNTCLCFLALCYGLPLAIMRWGMILLRTVFALSVFLIGTLMVMCPVTLVLKLFLSKEGVTAAIHSLLHRIGKFVMEGTGIPGAICSKTVALHDPYRRPAMVICNHQSSLDLMLMLAESPKLSILTKDWVYNNAFFGYTLRSGEYYPVSEGMESLLPKLRSLVDRGYSIMMYPEGTRSQNGEIQRFHKGAFRIARELGLDILPLVEYAPGRVLAKNGYCLHRGIIHIERCRRVTPEEYMSIGDDGAVAKWFRRYYKMKYDELSDKLINELTN